MNNLPIGVFDSGIGGLTVVSEIIKTIPTESIVYLGDTARVPYGTRDEETIKKFSLELVNFLLKQKVKALVVACNTMSAVSLAEIVKASNVPVVNVIDPTVEFIAENFRNTSIELMATPATVKSKAYEHKFKDIGIQIKSISCPLLVPIIEDGLLEGEVPEALIKMYLGSVGPDVLILGSTHYPLLSRTITKVLGNKTSLINTGHPTAQRLLELLYEKKLLAKRSNPNYKFYVTDDTEKTEEVAKLFFGEDLPIKLERARL